MEDVFGQALLDYYNGHSRHKLWIYNQYGPKEEMPIGVYFRSADGMPALEIKALQACRGTVLDIGAGAGSHALFLQQEMIPVTALEISPSAVSVMQARGVYAIIKSDVFTYTGTQYNTLLLLMNGIGLAGTIEGLRKFLQHAKSLLLPGGQILLDSSDVKYVYEETTMPTDRYYGEIAYQYGYKRNRTQWFNWLYIDKVLLQKIAAEEGWLLDVLFQDEYDQYLARLTRNT